VDQADPHPGRGTLPNRPLPSLTRESASPLLRWRVLWAGRPSQRQLSRRTVMTTIESRTSSLADATATPVKVSVVIPCLNEEENIVECVTRARRTLQEHQIPGEVIVADNASEDRSAELARGAGARVVHEPRRGYGSAYLAGFSAARGDYIVMADADLTYDFGDIPKFVEEMDAGGHLVMGDRIDNLHPGAMPWLHRYVGNPVLSGILNTFFRTGVRDAHCGMRAVRRDVLPR